MAAEKKKTGKAEASGAKLHLRQKRSLAGRQKYVIDTVKALGLGKIGKESTIVANVATRGMVKSVAYLLDVKEV